MNKAYLYIFLFFIYSFLGWLLEVIDIYIEKKTISNRGFLLEPICPIYGVFSLIMIYISSIVDNTLLLFLLSFFIVSATEYFTSILMEKLFNARWWDYSNVKCNLDGRVCLRNSILFSLLSVLFIKYIHPFILSFFPLNNSNLYLNYTYQTICLILIIILVIDYSFSIYTLSSISKNNNLVLKKCDNTDYIKQKSKEKLYNLFFKS